MVQEKKLAPFYILDILKEYTDQNHSLTQKEILEKLKSNYGVELERKSVGANLEMLMNLDYDIVKNPGGGYYLLEREFDETEVKFLTDAIFSSKIINAKQAQDLALKISKSLSRFERKNYNYVYKSTEVSRTSTQEFFYNIDVISEAIDKKKQISFVYLTYDKKGKLVKRYEGYRYHVSPYFMVNNFGKYYVIGNYYKYDQHINYRIDYISDIKLESGDIRPMEDIKTLGKNFNISKYINDHVYMFGGEIIDAKLEMLADFGIIYVKDWFGDNAKIKEEDGKTFVYLKTDERALFYWLLQYQEYVIIHEPQEIKQKIILTLNKSIQNYNPDNIKFDIDFDKKIMSYFGDDIAFRIDKIHSNEDLREDLVNYIRNHTPKNLKYYSRLPMDLVFETEEKLVGINIVYADGNNIKDKLLEINKKLNVLESARGYTDRYLLLVLHNDFLNYEIDGKKFKNKRKLGNYNLNLYGIPNTPHEYYHKYALIKI